MCLVELTVMLMIFGNLLAKNRINISLLHLNQNMALNLIVSPRDDDDRYFISPIEL
jgi:hypothetical protein